MKYAIEVLEKELSVKEAVAATTKFHRRKVALEQIASLESAIKLLKQHYTINKRV